MKKLTRSSDRKLSGVLGGIADYMNVDANVLRLIFIVVALFTAVIPCVILYIIAHFIIPEY